MSDVSGKKIITCNYNGPENSDVIKLQAQQNVVKKKIFLFRNHIQNVYASVLWWRSS